MLSQNVHPDRHISDQELLLANDDELSTRRAAQVHTHLEGCRSCRARMSKIEAASIGFARVQRQVLDPQLPSIAGPRALLRAQLREQASTSKVRSWGWLPQLPSAVHVVIICAAIFSAALLGILGFQHSTSRGADVNAGPLERGTVPDPGLTPGVVRTVTIRDVCSMAHEQVIANVSTALRQTVLQEYGIVNARAGDYEIDYLIAPGLGGIEDIHNLWPEPYRSYAWNAHVKDALEEHLHQMVCARELDLRTAQRDIATDWVAAYKKYFHTDRPLSLRSDLGPKAWLGSQGSASGQHPKASHGFNSILGFDADAT